MTSASVGLDGFTKNVRERNRFVLSLPLIFGIGIYALIITHPSVVLRDPDTFWHIAVGRWIIAHGTVPDHGIFSATMSTTSWVDGEWLGEVLMAWGYDHLGWLALSVGTALCEAAAIAILLRVLLGVLPPVYAMFATILAGALWLPHILARPYILAIPILTVWVAALVQARSENRAPRPWLALLIVLWANLHGSFMFGIGLAVFLAAEAVLLASDWPARIRAARDWGFFGVLAVAAALVTPYGYKSILAPVHLANMAVLPYIAEFHAVDFSQTSARPLGLWLLAVLFAALTLGWRLPPTRVGILLFLLAMALKHARYGEYLGLISSLLLAPALALHFDRPTKPTDRLMADLAKPVDWRGAVMASVLFTIATIALPRETAHPLNPISPDAAIAEVQAQHIMGPVLNDYLFGGYLIFSGIEPFIDGRAEVYGDAFLKRYIDAVSLTNDDLPLLLKDYGIAWTLFPPNTAAAILMDHLPGWRRLHTGSVAVVHAKQ